MRYGETQGPGQLATSPVEGVKTWAPALVHAGHLLDHHFRVGIHMQARRIQRDSALQCFHQGDVFGDVAVLTAYPFCDSDRIARGPLDHYSDPRGPGISEGTAIDMCNQIRHAAPSHNNQRRAIPRQDACLVRTSHISLFIPLWMIL